MSQRRNHVVTITVLPMDGLHPVSETPAGLPGLSNPDPRDGRLTFTPAVGESYSYPGMGLILGASGRRSATALRPATCSNIGLPGEYRHPAGLSDPDIRGIFAGTALVRPGRSGRGGKFSSQGEPVGAVLTPDTRWT